MRRQEARDTLEADEAMPIESGDLVIPPIRPGIASAPRGAASQVRGGGFSVGIL